MVGLDKDLSPSHYLIQRWLIVIWIIANKFQWNLEQNKTISIQENEFENYVCKMATILSQPHCDGKSLTPANGLFGKTFKYSETCL